MKPWRNNSAVLKRPSAEKNSSSRSIFLVVLLISSILGIIGSVLFFIFRSQRNRQDDDRSPLNRVSSDESYQSDMDESEMSTGENPETPPINKTRKGGLMISQLDPDAI